MTTQCPKCKAENPDDSKFCKECASPLKPPGDISVTRTIKTPTKGIAKGTIIAGKYQILQKLGEGGMGIVYKAKDSRLDRTVALKFLSSDLIKDKEAKKRFIQEAKAAAALEHPNICTVYEVDETDGQTFIAMSYIEGQSLKDKFSEGPLDVDETKGIALQIAEGLKEAHEKGIVHRDIKPANIMLTKKGQAKITDFGLAKLSWGLDLTKTSTIMGTVAYMSPEQAKGEEVDQRTDIWSLGAIMYEMLSGERPFQKNQEQALIFAILNDKPTPVSLLRSDIPTHIELVIGNTLAKKVTDRYQNVADFIQDLKQSQPLIFPKAEQSIIVLPFENLSPDPEQEYFCDGMTEEIISDLSKVQALKVISRSSAMTFKGTKKKIREIADDVKVQYVLEGSVRKSGNSLRITAQLIEAANDVHLWAEKYRGTLDDVFDIQEKVSRSIVGELKLKLSPEERQNITERPLENLKAYECYLKAKHEIDTFTEEGLDRAIQHLESGLKIIGESAILYAGLGYAYWQYFNIGMQEKYLNKGLEYARKALELDPDSSEGHFITGNLYFFHGTPRNMKKIIFHLKRALELDPNNCEALFHLEVVYLWLGKTAAVVSLVEKHLNIDPLSFYGHWSTSLLHLFEGRPSHALAPMAQAYKLAPGVTPMEIFYALILAYNDRLEEAFSIIDQSQKSAPDHAFTQVGVFLKYALQKKKEETLKSITPQILKWGRLDFTSPGFLVQGYSMIGETEEALNWLEEWIRLGCINYPFINEHDPFLENIRNEPRFKKLMERVKHEWDNFEV
jgi:serine/threonine protein kinase